MDPNVCWKQFLAATATGDRDEAADQLLSLCDWLGNGGFAPRGVPEAAVFTLYDWLRH